MFRFSLLALVLGHECLHLVEISVSVRLGTTYVLFCQTDPHSSVVLMKSINYIYLFEFDPRNIDTPIDIFNDAVDELLVFLLLMLMPVLYQLVL